jgi:hypothetical protein
MVVNSNVRQYAPPGTKPRIGNLKGSSFPVELLGREDQRPQAPYLSPAPKVSKATKFAKDFIAEQKRQLFEDEWFEKLRSQQNLAPIPNPGHRVRIVEGTMSLSTNPGTTGGAGANGGGGGGPGGNNGPQVINNYHYPAAQPQPPRPPSHDFSTDTHDLVQITPSGHLTGASSREVQRQVDSVTEPMDAEPQRTYIEHHHHTTNIVNTLNQDMQQHHNNMYNIAYNQTDTYQQYNEYNQTDIYNQQQWNIHNDVRNTSNTVNQLNLNVTSGPSNMDIDNDGPSTSPQLSQRLQITPPPTALAVGEDIETRLRTAARNSQIKKRTAQQLRGRVMDSIAKNRTAGEARKAALNSMIQNRTDAELRRGAMDSMIRNRTERELRNAAMDSMIKNRTERELRNAATNSMIQNRTEAELRRAAMNSMIKNRTAKELRKVAKTSVAKNRTAAEIQRASKNLGF